ncbi:MAG TPA: hypothetical protein PKD96_03920, partial [Candidatus Absconditabacterales bacterium]|nr:hypothetical protein [Candidatus Absconditabacterales bacterium]
KLYRHSLKYIFFVSQCNDIRAGLERSLRQTQGPDLCCLSLSKAVFNQKKTFPQAGEKFFW